MSTPGDADLWEFINVVEDGDASDVASFVASHAIDVNAPLPLHCSDKPPALVHAAGLGRTPTVEVLLRLGAHIDATDARGQTACHLATANGETETLQALLAHGPDLGIKSAMQRTALDVALLGTTMDGDSSALALLAAGAPFDVQSVKRENFCYFAVSSTDALKVLLSRGVVVSELRFGAEQTLLHLLAARSEDPALFDMLVNECGVDLDARNSRGATCAHVATVEINPEVLRLIIAAGADIDCGDIKGRTPLHVVRDHECALVLLAAGADVRLQDRDGVTAAFQAAVRDDAPLVHAFLAAGVDLDALGRKGITLRQIMAKKGMAVDAELIEIARRRLASARLDFVRWRALQVCVGLHSLGLDALQMCEILRHACGPMAPLVAFHQWWAIATTVKHFKSCA